MVSKIVFKLVSLIVFCCCILTVSIALADSRDSEPSKLKLVVRPSSTIRNIPLEKLCANVKIKSNDNILLDNRVRALSKGPISIQIGQGANLVLRSQSPDQQFEVKIKRKKENLCNFGIFVTREEWLNYANSHLDDYGTTLVAASMDWLIIQPVSENKYFNDEADMDLITSIASAASSSDNGTFSTNTDFEYGSGTINTRGACKRLWDPTKLTRYGSGIVVWANNPVPAGFSIKDENNSSGYTSALRCPKGPYKTEYSVDGAYRKGWGPFAYKVPDHCTATRVVIGGRSGWNCCCNLAGTAVGGGECSYINGLSFRDWPDAPKTTCR